MKKLLAVVLSAAMVLGMSTVAFAEGTENVAVEPTLVVEGNKVHVSVEGEWNLINEVTVTWDEAAVVESQAVDMMGFGLAKMGAGMMGDLVFNDTVAGQVILACALTNSSGALLNYTGPVYTITFAEGTTTDVTMGEQTVTVGASAPTDAPTDAPVDPTNAPVDPTNAPVDPTNAPADEDPTKAPEADDKEEATKAPGTSTGKVDKVPQTADVAPVATMAVLALAAAAVVVAMKKRVTE